MLNLLSVGAAYGMPVWIFQDGHLQRVLGFHSTGAIVTWLPLFLFAVLFGLSMDYHVFIVSRIKELRDRGVPTREAVARGIRGTASTVTSAAAVMVAVFAIFASLRTIDIKQLGVGLAVAAAARRRRADPAPPRARRARAGDGLRPPRPPAPRQHCGARERLATSPAIAPMRLAQTGAIVAVCNHSYTHGGCPSIRLLGGAPAAEAT